MNKILFSTIAIFSLLSVKALEGSIQDHQEIYADELTNRFILTSDNSIDTVANIPLRDTWWSRPHEYAWAAQFAGEDYVVLDAACGISHPFKWYLGETCKTTWACDVDGRIDNIESIIQETFDDLGETAYDILVNTPRLYEQVNLVRASISQLPDSMPQFDRIFCISTLEHLSAKDQTDAITEFAKFLAPDGLLILTTDHPEVTPEAIIALADSVGLVPVGEVQTIRPSKDLLTNGYLSIFRYVFAHRDNR